ncbi:MAG: hypothetical protein GF333_05610 [Candidatus Omnitrophica bacterium]|nr:hypothetical protein [Candidatus Omnitrophota bacterium]
MDQNTADIKISRVIPAPKAKVLRLLTKVTDFPAYVPCVKNAEVISSYRRAIRTRWHIQAEKLPIRWIEDDRLDLRNGKIYFRAVEGDLRTFEGCWTVSSHPEGTLLELAVKVSVGIPAIEEFADSYLRRLLTQSFEAICEALEKRIISLRYMSSEGGSGDKIAGFGVIGHFYNFYHLEKSLKMLNPDYHMPSREFLAQLFHVTPSFKMYESIGFQSKTGQQVDGCFILATFIPDMIEKDMWGIFSKVIKACKIAEKHGVGIVTLGGFTSIVAERIGHAISEHVDVPVTTGNTFTAAMTLDGVSRAAQLLGLDLADAHVAVIGGTGDIGSACVRVCAGKVRKLSFTGRTKANLRRLRAECAGRKPTRVQALTDNHAAVKDADIIIAAASVSHSILSIDWFKPGAIICDVGYPKNVSYHMNSRDDILVFSGGLALSPTPLRFPIDTGLPDPRLIYGCFAEAIILALEKRYENYSFGRGNIYPEKVKEISRLGEKHGFHASPFYWGGREVDESILDKVRSARDAQTIM